MLTVPFNPYTWDKTADKVRSYVVSLQLKDNKGSAVTVDNLKSKIHIAIPRRANNKSDTWEGDKFFIKPSKEGKMQHHVVNVDLDGSSMKIKVRLRYLHSLIQCACKICDHMELFVECVSKPIENEILTKSPISWRAYCFIIYKVNNSMV